MMTPLPYASYLEAEARAGELERQAEVERMLANAPKRPGFRLRLARILTSLAHRLEAAAEPERRPGRT